jgi:DNA-binding XRE family transcriptional regulator
LLSGGAEQEPANLSPADQLKAISKTFSLSKVELAKALGVSRQTLYDWLEGRPMSPENEDRVLQLAHLAWDFGGKDGQSLLRRMVDEPLWKGEDSFLKLLLSHPWDETKLRRALGEAKARTERKKTTSASAWLRSLGFSEPGPSEKAANLGHNLLLDELKRP